MELVGEQQRLAKLGNAYRAAESDSTPLALAMEMVSKIPEEVIKNRDSKFLDPCAGTGTFLVALFDRLSEYHNVRHILVNMLHGFDISATNNKILTKKLGFINITRADFLNTSTDMKFDVIIGNPPYQSPTNKSNKLWITFIENCIKDCEHLSFVVPTLLLKSDSNRITALRSIMQGRSNIFDLSNQDVFNVGEKVVSFVSTESDNPSSTILFSNGITKDFTEITNRLPVELEDIPKLRIIDKIDNYTSKNEYVYDFSLNSNKTTPNSLISQGLVSKEKSEEFCYKVHHSASKILYSNTTHSPYCNNYPTHGKLKVALNYSGNFTGEKYMFLTRDMIGKQMLGIEVNSEEEGLNIIEVYSSKLISWYITNEKKGGFNTGLFKLPRLDFTRRWTDLELYDHFCLTEEEIEIVETNRGYNS